MRVTIHVNVTLIEGRGDPVEVVKRSVLHVLQQQHDHSITIDQDGSTEDSRVRWEPSSVVVTVDA